MAPTFKGNSTALKYTTVATFSGPDPNIGYSSTTNVGTMTAPSGGITPGDQLILQVAYNIAADNSGNIFPVTPTGWTAVANTPTDQAIGASSSARRQMRLYSRVADGTAADLPTLYVQSTVTTGSQNAFSIVAVMQGYGGWDFTFYNSGSLGGIASGTLTPAASTSVPDDSFILSGAYGFATNTVPTMHTDNGFASTLALDPDLTRFYPPTVAVSSFSQLTAASVALPRWNVQQGDSAGEHHAYWVVWTVVPIPPPPSPSGWSIGYGNGVGWRVS